MRKVLPFLLAITTAATCESSTEPQPVRYSLTLSTSGTGSGALTASPSGESFAEGTQVTVTAAPAAGSAFTGWTGACEGMPNPCVLVMLAARVVGGHFVPASGAGQYDGSYAGSWTGGQSSGAVLSGPLTAASANGTLTGDFAPISGSLRAMTGTVSASGAVTASIPAGTGGCAVNLGGQLSTSVENGITVATLQGTYTLVQSATCNSASGTWTATRR